MKDRPIASAPASQRRAASAATESQHRAAQKPPSGIQAYVDGSPRMLAQLRMLESLASTSAAGPSGGSAELGKPPASSSAEGETIQRVVSKSTAPWGDLKGKWVTSLDTSVGFDTQEQAQKHEDEVRQQQELEQQAAAQQEEHDWEIEADAKAWEFADYNGRLTTHFGDGWGEGYGITNYGQLRARILQDVDRDNEALGAGKEIDMGNQLNSNEHLSRPCKIKYDVVSVITVSKGPITRQTVKRRVFHCGPTSQ